MIKKNEKCCSLKKQNAAKGEHFDISSITEPGACENEKSERTILFIIVRKTTIVLFLSFSSSLH